MNKNVTVIGTQWGDEGKGKIVDWLAQGADAVVRFQGGHNAGHTLVVDGHTHKLSLLPSGVLQGKLAIIGNGVVLNVSSLLDEISQMSSVGIGISPNTLRISDSAVVLLPIHAAFDQATEASLHERQIGTTGRGIGPAYEDKVGRRAIRVGDLWEDDLVSSKLSAILAHYNPLLSALGAKTFRKEPLQEYVRSIRPHIQPYLVPVWQTLISLRGSGKSLVFEGAQAVMLDVDHGTYPYVTSSNTVPAAAAIGVGVGVSALGAILGVAKAYTTRVGNGPFPTEVDEGLASRLRSRGGEFGTVTGRPRRCGWFDAVMVRQAVQLGGIDLIALTKLDVLDGFDSVNICVAYQLDGHNVRHFPSTRSDQDRLIPIYREMKGWSSPTAGRTAWSDLPPQAIQYLECIQELIGVPIAIVSTGPDRRQTIVTASWRRTYPSA